MKPVRRNSKEFKRVEKLLKQYAGKKDRKKFIRIYAAKNKSDEKLSLNGRGKEMAVVYDLNYDSILTCLEEPNQKLYRSEEKALYAFRTSPNGFDEFTFEFEGKLEKQVLAGTK